MLAFQGFLRYHSSLLFPEETPNYHLKKAIMISDHDHSSPLLAADESTSETSTSTHRPRSRIQRTISLMLSPLIDESGSGWGVVYGLCTLFLIGSFLGWILPKNEALPTPFSQALSSCLGYTYFLAWSTSFWPQVISNLKRRSTRGLSPEFCGLNVLGFAAYAVYNMSLFWSPTIRELYKQRHGANAEITVQSNDVAFAIHAFILASITLLQIAYYDGVRALKPTRYIGYVMCGIVAVCVVYALLVIFHIDGFNWLDYLYMLSFVKIFISLIKYIPQVVLNFQRKSTVGWSIWNILLDFTGGTLSDLQLVLDCAFLGDWSGITGNIAKLCLGLLSMTFDVIFMVQHYILYPHYRGETRPLLVYEDTKTDV